MKKLYSIFILVLVTSLSFSQSYQLGLVSNDNYNFKVVAIPDFDSTGNTNNLDAGFTLMLPAGAADVSNPVGLLGSRAWDVTQYDAATLTAVGGNGTQDAFQFNLPAGSTMLQHTNGQIIDLVSFDITSMPVSGQIAFLANNDPIATTAGIFDSFYQTDLDGPGGMATGDYFSGLASGMESFMFSTLSTEEQTLKDVSVSMYPNPATDYVTISSQGGMTFDLIKIYDLNGRLVKQASLNNSSTKTSINVSELNSANYLMLISGSEGQITKRLLKK